MRARADWHQAELVVDDLDALFEPAERIEDVGVPIRLSGDQAELAAELVDLVHREKQLRGAGVDCAIRNLADTSCSACPIAGRAGELCTNARRQEQLLTLLAVLEHGG